MKDFEINATAEDFNEVFRDGWINVTVRFGDRKIDLYAETNTNELASPGESICFVAAELNGDENTKVCGGPKAAKKAKDKMKEFFNKDDLRLMTVEECAGHTIEYAAGWKACIDWIKSVPAPPERKTGRWIPVDCYSACGGDEVTWMAHGNPTAFYYCSECKEQCYAGEDGESLLTSFCPCCGAKMEGGTE